MHKQLVDIEAVYGLEGYIQKGDFIELEPYKPSPYREMNFPLYPKHLTRQTEIEFLNSMEDEILVAIAKEQVVKLENLDLETFKTKSGFQDSQISKMLERRQQRI